MRERGKSVSFLGFIGERWRISALGEVQRIWTKTTDGPAQTSHLHCSWHVYIQNKPTQKMCSDLIFCSRYILKMHGGSSSALCAPQETSDFGLVSKFTQWNLTCYSSMPIKLVRMPELTIRMTAPFNLQRVHSLCILTTIKPYLPFSRNVSLINYC